MALFGSKFGWHQLFKFASERGGYPEGRGGGGGGSLRKGGVPTLEETMTNINKGSIK